MLKISTSPPPPPREKETVYIGPFRKSKGYGHFAKAPNHGITLKIFGVVFPLRSALKKKKKKTLDNAVIAYMLLLRILYGA